MNTSQQLQKKTYKKRPTVCACGRPAVKVISGGSICARCLSLPDPGEYLKGNYRNETHP